MADAPQKSPDAAAFPSGDAAGGHVPAAAPAAGAVSPPAPAAESAAPAAPAEAPKSDSPPSPLASADAGNRAGAPKPDAGAKPAEVPPPGDAKADAKPDAGKPDVAQADKTGEAKPKDGDAAAAAKPAEAKTEPEAKPADDVKADAKPEAPVAPPSYEPYRLPDNVKLDDKELGAFNALMGEFETVTKAPHAEVQALNQKLIDRFTSEVVRIHEQRDQYQRDVWNRLTETRFNELKADPEIGGNRIETTLGNVKYLIQQAAGNTDEAAAVIAALDAGGVSAHRVFIKAMNNLYERYVREPEPTPPINPDASHLMKSTPGNRNWYTSTDGVTPPR